MEDRKQGAGNMDGALFVVDDNDDFEDESEGREPKGSPGDGKAEQAAEILASILQRMDLDARVSVREDGERVVLDVHGNDAGRAIGKKGATLNALQFLVNKIVNRFPRGRRHIVVDSGDYRDRYDDSLVSMAKREAKRAVQQGRVITLEPMSPRDRRVVHMSLAKFPGVQTRSNGEGLGRRIQIIPARGRDGREPQAGGGGRGRGARGGGGPERGFRRGPRDNDDRPRDRDRTDQDAGGATGPSSDSDGTLE